MIGKPPSYACAMTVLLVGLLHTRLTHGCLWDLDTFPRERQRFPSTLELITGKFLRHSCEFYRWRVQDRRKRLQGDPDNLPLYDDLAVAYEKLGEHARAIETMREKDRRQPGLYETYANLGTFYIHAGDLEEGLRFIERAIEINPDAHFGREVYQRSLVRYVLAKSADGELSFPLRYDEPSGHFGEFLADVEGDFNDAAARKGVLGMMRFGNFDSPVLLEALGDLLRPGQLPARAYLKAAYETTDTAAKERYRELADRALRSSRQKTSPIGGKRFSLEAVEAAFQAELEEAEEWYGRVRENEIRWIREGLDPDEEFAALYYEEPRVSDRLYDRFLTLVTINGALNGAGFVGFWGIISLVALRIALRIRAKRKWREAESAGEAA